MMILDITECVHLIVYKIPLMRLKEKALPDRQTGLFFLTGVVLVVLSHSQVGTLLRE